MVIARLSSSIRKVLVKRFVLKETRKYGFHPVDSGSGKDPNLIQTLAMMIIAWNYTNINLSNFLSREMNHNTSNHTVLQIQITLAQIINAQRK